MLDHIFLFSGASAVGKTSVLRSLIPLLQHKGAGPVSAKSTVCKAKTHLYLLK